MDFLSNLNVIVGIIASLIAIGTTILGISKYLQKKAIPVQKVETMQLLSSKQSLLQTTYKPLSKLDWMEVLWCGLEDSVKARGGEGAITSFMVGLFGLIIMGVLSMPVLAFIVFYTLFILVNLTFYTYFVGRRVEKKIEDINQGIVQKKNSQQSY